MDQILNCDIYARQSLGNISSIDEQTALGRARAEVEDWPVHAVYRDRVSASRYAQKVREDWPRLLADVQAGRARVIWLWESSRVTAVPPPGWRCWRTAATTAP